MKSVKKKAKKFFVPFLVIDVYMSGFIEDFDKVKEYLNKVYCLDINKILKIEMSSSKFGREVFYR
jgi:hypothetical protein